MSRRIRRFLQAAVSVLFVVLIAAACSSDGFPQGYDDQVIPDGENAGLSLVEANFLEGCEVGITDSDLAEDANTVCACSYQKLSSSAVIDGVPEGIPFEDFFALNNDIKSDPEVLSREGAASAAQVKLVDIVKNCIATS